jgi:hypothetical protein
MSWKMSIPEFLTKSDVLKSDFLQTSAEELVTTASFEFVSAFDFGRIISKDFFTALRCMAKRANSDQMLVATINPDFIGYYHRHFGMVPAFDIGIEMNDLEFIHNLNLDPDGGGSDSIASHAEKMIALDDNISWIVLGERRFELARLFVRRDMLHLNLQNCLPDAWCYDQENLFESLLDVGVDEKLAKATANELTR